MVSREMPVWALTMETLALGTIAPVASVTVPLNSAVAVCAAAGRVKEIQNRIVAKNLRAFMALPPISKVGLDRTSAKPLEKG